MSGKKQIEDSTCPTRPGSPRKKPAAPLAEPGSLHPEVASDIAVLHEFFGNRDRLIARLFGRAVRRNPVRDELLRQVMLQFASGVQRSTSFYIRACSFLATAPSVRSELTLLAHAELIRLCDNTSDKRAKLVAPTAPLVNWYNEHMPSLRREVMALLAAMPPG